ncbi:MAG TPA: phosphoribosyltransferase [Terriglobales bacterium]|nr:phosphoribosyltransferase [Terriglobales bacterium]
MLPFRDRKEAGERLGRALSDYAGRENLLVLALPRGGVPVGYEVALALAAPLDIFVVRKLGAPGNPELAIGAVAPGGVCILQQEIIDGLEISAETVAAIAAREEQVRRQSEDLYRRNLPPQTIEGSTVIVVDDGIATGATMKAAVPALRSLWAEKIVIAVPVAPRSTCRELEVLADQVVCLATPEIFFTVGQWYVNFEQVSDEQMAALLTQSSTAATRSDPCHYKS